MTSPTEAHVETRPPASTPLEEREAAVLAELGREHAATVAFQGLRRRLGLHQEILSRTLRRLERDGLLQHTEHGYRLTEEGASATQPALRGPPRGLLQVAQGLLPPGTDVEGIAEHLVRRWFRGLRWYGRSDGPTWTTLLWLAEPDTTMVRVRLAGDTYSLEVEVPPAGARNAFAAARAILSSLAEVYGLPADASKRVVGLSAVPGFAA